MCWKSFKKVYRRIFFLIAVFWKPALEITKRAQHCVLQRLLERIKPFRKYPKSSKFVCIKSSLRCMHNLCPFCRNSKISRSSSHRFSRSFAQQKTFIQRIRFQKNMPNRAEIRIRAKTIVTQLSSDIYSDRTKTTVMIKFGLIVIRLLQWFYSKDRFD